MCQDTKHMNELFCSDEANPQKSKWFLLLFLFLALHFLLKEKKPILFLRSRRSGAEAWGCVKLQCVRGSTKPPRAPRVASVLIGNRFELGTIETPEEKLNDLNEVLVQRYFSYLNTPYRLTRFRNTSIVQLGNGWKRKEVSDAICPTSPGAPRETADPPEISPTSLQLGRGDGLVGHPTDSYNQERPV